MSSRLDWLPMLFVMATRGSALLSAAGVVIGGEMSQPPLANVVDDECPGSVQTEGAGERGN